MAHDELILRDKGTTGAANISSSRQSRGINAPRVMRANERLRNRENKNSKEKSHHYHGVIEAVLPGEGQKPDLGHNFSPIVYIVWSHLTLAEDHLCEPRWCSGLWGRGSCSLNSFSLGKMDLSAPLSRDPEQERGPRNLIACHVALKNHIFMGVNESETYG